MPPDDVVRSASEWSRFGNINISPRKRCCVPGDSSIHPWNTMSAYQHLLCLALYSPRVFAGKFVFVNLIFTLLLQDKPSVLPPGTCLHFYRVEGSAFPTGGRFPSNVVDSRSRAFRKSTLCTRRSPDEYRRACSWRGSNL